MARIPNVDPEAVESRIRAVLDAQRKKWGAPLLNHLIYARRLDAQRKKWGAPLLNHLIYARRPSIFHAVRGMWSGIDASGLIDPKLEALINRRVAYLNGCEF